MYAIETEKYKRELNGALAVAHMAGSIMLHCHDLDYAVTMKAGADSPASAIFTEVDGRIDHIVQDYYKQNWPNDQLLTEETEPEEAWFNHPRIWIVDPLDGTMGYQKKTGSYGISIALIENGRPVVGVIYAPSKNLIAWAIAGEGTYLNGRKVNLSTEYALNTILCSSNHLSSPPYQRALDVINPNQILKIMATESVVVKALLILNHEGEIYPILPKTEETKSVPKFWDIAAADLLIHEAGGKVTTFSGDVYRYDIPEIRCIKGVIMGTKQGHEYAFTKFRTLI